MRKLDQIRVESDFSHTYFVLHGSGVLICPVLALRVNPRKMKITYELPGSTWARRGHACSWLLFLIWGFTNVQR